MDSEGGGCKGLEILKLVLQDWHCCAVLSGETSSSCSLEDGGGRHCCVEDTGSRNRGLGKAWLHSSDGSLITSLQSHACVQGMILINLMGIS